VARLSRGCRGRLRRNWIASDETAPRYRGWVWEDQVVKWALGRQVRQLGGEFDKRRSILRPKGSSSTASEEP